MGVDSVSAMRKLHLVVRASMVVALGALGMTSLATEASGVVPNSASYVAPAHHRDGAIKFLTIPALRQARAHHVARLSSRLHRASTNDLIAQGGVNGVETVVGTPKVYLVYWGTQWGTESTAGTYPTFSGDPQGMAPRLEAMLAGLGTNAEKWSGVMTQYCDGVALGTVTCAASATHISYPSSSVLAGVWYDNSAAAPSNATGHQLAAEAVAAASHFGNLTSASNRNVQYVVVSPTGTHPDGFNTPSGNFCAYHDYNGDSTLSGGGAVASSVGDVAFTNLPYVPDMGASCGANYVNAGSAGALDGVTIVEGHEYAETLTDMYPAGGWVASNGYETGDLCAWVGTGGTGGAQNVTFATGSFAMQGTWSNATGACAIAGPTIANGNSFSLSTSPSSATVLPGGSTSTTVSSTVTSGSTQTVNLSVSGLPAGVQATFGSPSISAGSSTNVTFASTSTTTPGTYVLTITGAGATSSATTTFTLTVQGPSDFSLTPSVTSGSVSAGTSTSVTLLTSTTSGSPETIGLSASVASGVTASISPSSVTSGTSATMTLSTTSSTTPGNYVVTVTGTAPSGIHTATFTLQVTAPVSNTFSMSVSPSSGSTRAGRSVSTTLSTTVVTGSAQAISLSSSGAPRGVSVVFAKNPLTAGGSETVTFRVARGTPVGSAVISLKGTSSSFSTSTSYTLSY